ncbi:hypothetical protein AB0L71_28415 [Streptomyces sp. NPDC052052]|uniref:hypothetical protein n=1 Tax=Streptomyces sp. NPDC052052 TaxID=3154756 RepID=UPI003421E860
MSDNEAMQALSDAGAVCGNCGDEPGDRTCPDCERCYQRYAAALRAAGWAPRAEVLADPIETEYGIRLTPDGPEAEVLNYASASRAVVEDRLARHRTGYPDAHLLQRTVRHGKWTDAPQD